MENCYISAIQVGRVEITKYVPENENNPRGKEYVMDLTGQEFEAVHPVFERKPKY